MVLLLFPGLEKHGFVDNLEADFKSKDGQIRTGIKSHSSILNDIIYQKYFDRL